MPSNWPKAFRRYCLSIDMSFSRQLAYRGYNDIHKSTPYPYGDARETLGHGQHDIGPYKHNQHHHFHYYNQPERNHSFAGRRPIMDAVHVSRLQPWAVRKMCKESLSSNAKLQINWIIALGTIFIDGYCFSMKWTVRVEIDLQSSVSNLTVWYW